MIREKIVVKNDQVLEDHTYAKTTRDNDIDMARDTEDDLAFEDPKHEKEEINTIRDNAIDMVLDVDNVFGDPEYVEELLDIINDNTIIAIFCMDGDKDFIDPEHVKKYSIRDLLQNVKLSFEDFSSYFLKIFLFRAL